MGFLSDLFIEKRKYDHIVSLGNNCEFSFQFFMNYKFVEANLFSWVYVLSPEKLLEAVAHPDLIFSEGIGEPDWLYVCNKYGIKFHGRASGKELLDADGKPVPEVVARDKAELRERVAHLQEKFSKVLETSESKLYVLKDPVSLDYVLQMKRVLDRVVKHGYDFLVIVAEEELGKYKGLETASVFVRAVKHFSPTEDVTSKKKADMKGWKKIMKEVVPARILPKSKKYKFEEV